MATATASRAGRGFVAKSEDLVAEKRTGNSSGGMVMATTTETALQAKTFGAGLTVNDLQRSISFFEGLGFAVEDRWEDNGALLGVMLRARPSPSVTPPSCAGVP